jgi:hypothetical protein
VAAKNKSISIAGRFDGHARTLEQYRRHCPMQHVQSYPRSHWMPQSGDYLLCIALAATRVTGNNTTIKNWTNFAGHFDGRGGAPVQYRAHCLVGEVQGFGRSHWMLLLDKYCSQ